MTTLITAAKETIQDLTKACDFIGMHMVDMVDVWYYRWGVPTRLLT